MSMLTREMNKRVQEDERKLKTAKEEARNSKKVVKKEAYPTGNKRQKSSSKKENEKIALEVFYVIKLMFIFSWSQTFCTKAFEQKTKKKRTWWHQEKFDERHHSESSMRESWWSDSKSGHVWFGQNLGSHKPRTSFSCITFS